MSENNTTPDWLDWLYILFTLLIMGLKFIKDFFPKNKKTQEPKNNPEQLPKDFWENEEVESHTDLVPEAESSIYTFTPRKEKYNVQEPSVNTHQGKEEEENSTEEIDFDLKKAIIYNEILNRKYE